ncbi:MAG: class I SAM-dependent methyltransferase [Candidatus Bruticola sp.]
MAVGAAVWCGLNYDTISDGSIPKPPAALEKAAAKPAPANKDHGLPDIPVIVGEADLKKAVDNYLTLLKKAEASGDAPSLQKLAEVLNKAHQLPPNTDYAMLYMYKYPLRSALEKLVELDPKLASLKENASYYADQSGNWQVNKQNWQFQDFEEAVYQAYYKDKNPDFPLIRSLEILLAVRNRDYECMQKLHNEIGLGPAPQWPLEAFRQLYTYAGSEGGQKQMEELKKLLPAGKSWQGADWCEIGYGSGKIFSSLRNELGSQGTIWAVEIDDSCKRFVRDLQSSGCVNWGTTKYIDGTYRNCCMPANSVDVVHAGLIHIGDGPEELLQRDWLPLLGSIKKALKPGGLLLVDDGGDPTIERVRYVMKMAGFKEVSLVLGSNTDSKRPCFVAAFTPEHK